MASPAPRRLAVVALASLARFARVATPVVRRGLGHGSRALARGLRALGRGLMVLGRAARQRRAALVAVGHRVAWWSALVLLVVGGRAILGPEALPERSAALAPFVAGLLLCAAVRLLAAPRRLRVAALGLGALHGTALVLVWTAFAG
jgi:hypothetical protein